MMMDGGSLFVFGSFERLSLLFFCYMVVVLYIIGAAFVMSSGKKKSKLHKTSLYRAGD